MKKNNILILNSLLLLVMLVFDVLYILFEEQFAFKIVASVIFVLIGILNLIFAIVSKQNLKFPLLMLSGLVFAMLGDILLEIIFIVGAILFAIGHIFFFVSYCVLEKFKVMDLLYGIIIFIPSVLFMTLAPIFDYNGIVMELVCVVYALIISFMVGKSISLITKEKNILSVIILVGSILFFLSDLMLLLGVFANLSVVGIICLALYYPAEFLLAFSIFVYAIKKENENIKIIKNWWNNLKIKSKNHIKNTK